MEKYLTITMLLTAALLAGGCEALEKRGDASLYDGSIGSPDTPFGEGSVPSFLPDRDFVIPAVDIIPTGRDGGISAEAYADFATAAVLHARSDRALAEARGMIPLRKEGTLPSTPGLPPFSTRPPVRETSPLFSSAEERKRRQAEADELWKDAVEYYQKVLAIDPRAADACDRLGTGCLDRGETDKGLHWLKEAVRIDPGDFARLYRLGLQCERAGKIPDAIDAYAQAEKARDEGDKLKTLPLIVLKLANLYESQGRLPEAAATYVRFTRLERQPEALYEDNPALVELMKNYGPVYRKLGEIYAKLAMNKEAEDALREAWKLQPSVPQTLLKLAEVQRDAGQFAQAVDTCKQYIEQQPGRLDGMTLLVDVYKRMGQLDKAVAAAQEFLKEKPFLYQLHYLLGSLYEEKGDQVLGVAEYEIIVRDGKRFAPAYLRLVEIETKALRPEKALSVLAAGLSAGLEDEGFYAELDRRITEGAKAADLPARFRLAVEQARQDFAFYYVLGRLAQEMKKPAEAIAAYKEAVRLKPDFTHCTIRLASVYIADDRPKEAAEVLKAAAAKEPTNMMVWRFLADAQMVAGDDAGAADAMKHVVFLDPTNNQNTLLLVSLMTKAGQGEEAEKFLEDGLGKNPDDAERWSFILAMYYIENNRKLDRAVEVLKEAISDYPDSPMLITALGQAYLKRQEYGPAAEALRQAVHVEPDNMGLRAYLAMALERDKKLPEAEQELREALKVKPDSADVMVELGRFLVRTKRAPDEGIALLRKAVTAEPDETPNKLALAVALTQLKRHPEAVQLLTDVLKKTPDDSAARYQLAMVYDDMKDFPKAEAELKVVLKADPGDGPAANALGYMYAERSIKLDEAGKLVDVALKQDPENGAYLDSMGWVWYRKGDLAKAIEYLAKALERDKDSVIAEHLGDVLYRLGRKDEALARYEEAAKLDPESKTAPKKAELLKAGKDPLSVEK